MAPSATSTSFVEMSADEAQDYLAHSVAEFIAEQVALGADPEVARAEAQARQGSLLPQGPRTPGHEMNWIVGPEGSRLGQIWFGFLPTGRDGDYYLYDIRVEPEHRGRGVARAAVALAAAAASARGGSRIGLTVFTANEAALGLYESMGFQATRGDDGWRELWLDLHHL